MWAGLEFGVVVGVLVLAIDVVDGVLLLPVVGVFELLDVLPDGVRKIELVVSSSDGMITDRLFLFSSWVGGAVALLVASVIAWKPGV